MAAALLHVMRQVKEEGGGDMEVCSPRQDNCNDLDS